MSPNSRKVWHTEIDTLRFAPLKSYDQVAEEVRRYLEEKKRKPYTGRLGGKPGREHRAGGVK